jgi:CRP/FNR family transcriptional regulator
MLAEQMVTSAAIASPYVSRPSPAPTLQGLFSNQPVERIEGGSALFWEEDQADHVFHVVEGVLRVFKILGDGRRAITGFIYAGDILGVSFKDRYLYTAEAVTDVKVHRFSRSKFEDVVNQSAALRPQLFAQLCDEMATAQDQMVLLARKSAEERVGSFLLFIARRLQRSGHDASAVDLPMTRLDIADYLGLTIETVSRLMTRLTKRGVIAARDRHRVTIRDMNMLVRLSGEASQDEAQPHGSLPVRRAVWPH